MSEGKKHILLLSSWYPNRMSPFLGNFVQRQAELLSEIYKVSVLHTVADASISQSECKTTVTGNLTQILIYHPKGTNFISRRKEQEKALETGLNKIENVDLIHAHVILPKGHLFVKAKKRYSCALIITEHGSYYRKEKRKSWSLKDKFILRYTKKHIDHLIAVSEVLQSDMRSYFPLRKIQVIPNLINTELFVPISTSKALGSEQTINTKKNFLHISTLDKELKNLKGIIEAVELLRMKGLDNFKMTIISDEPYQEYKDYVASKDLVDYITFYGPLEPSELVSFYQKSDAFVLFSSYETFSIVLAEAWACGIPTITTPVGIAFNMPNDLGIIVKINDPLSLAMAMEKILNGLTFDSISIRNQALNYSKESVLNQLSTCYNKFLYANG